MLVVIMSTTRIQVCKRREPEILMNVYQRCSTKQLLRMECVRQIDFSDPTEALSLLKHGGIDSSRNHGKGVGTLNSSENQTVIECDDFRSNFDADSNPQQDKALDAPYFHGGQEPGEGQDFADFDRYAPLLGDESELYDYLSVVGFDDDAGVDLDSPEDASTLNGIEEGDSGFEPSTENSECASPAEAQDHAEDFECGFRRAELAT
jgi:hypothetical protein